MPNHRVRAAWVLGIVAALLVGCTSNDAARSRRTASPPARQATGPTAPAEDPLPAGGPTDPGTRYLPVGQPLGQMPVETPPFAVPPIPPPPPLATTP